MQHPNWLITAIILLCAQINCPAQNKNLNRFRRCSVKTINYEQGLANNETGSMVTDRWGFTWMSTKTGMQRFNGYVLENIDPIVGNDTILIDYPVIFFPLQNGNIWISYEQGILEYNPLKNIFKKVIELPANQGRILPVIPLLQNKEGIWCMYTKKGIVLYNENKRSDNFLTEPEIKFTDSVLQSGPFLYTRVNATNGNDIFLSNTRRILYFNTTTRDHHYIQNDSVPIIGIECSKTNLYITYLKSLALLDIATGRTLKNIPYKDITGEPVFSAEAYLVNENQLLVAIGPHLYEFDTSANYLREFITTTGDPVLSNGQIHLIYTDKFKRIWLMTNDDIKLIQNVEIPFSYFIYPGLKRNFVKCIYYDEEKNLVLAGCYEGGLLLFDTSGNRLWEKPLATDLAKDIMVIEKIAADNYLIETFYRGWFLLNLPSRKLTPFPIPASMESMLHSNEIGWTNNRQRINDSSVFICTKNNVFNCVFKNNEIRSAQPLLPPLSVANESMDCFIYTTKKALWAGTQTGKIYFKNTDGNIRTITIPGNFGIRTFAEDVQHNVWIGTDKGLYIYNSSGQLIKKITKQNGLLNDCIYALLPMNDKAAVFASTNFGLSYILLDGTIKNFTKEVGLQENEFNNGAACKTKDGKFYFGGVNGFTGFYPSSLSVLKDTPILNITRFVVNDSVYNTLSTTWNRDSVVLNYNQNHIQFDIAANGLLNADEYIYSYRLNNLGESWQTTRHPSAIRYTLEPGHYTLEVNCSPYLSSNTVFSKKFVIIIAPPWWQTWWFRLLAVICLVSVIALVVWQYNRNRYMKKIRALQLQQQIQHERERISRDLHDNLGAHVAAIVANVGRIDQPGEKERSHALNELQANSQSIVAQLHDTIWALNREKIALTAISDRFKVFLQKIRPSYPNIDINIKESIDYDAALSPANALHLFRIMQEAINNAVRHSGCTNVLIVFDSYSNWKVSIIDNGKGFSEAAKSNFGNGLRNMQQRAKEAGWRIEWLSEKSGGTRLEINAVV